MLRVRTLTALGMLTLTTGVTTAYVRIDDLTLAAFETIDGLMLSPIQEPIGGQCSYCNSCGGYPNFPVEGSPVDDDGVVQAGACGTAAACTVVNWCPREGGSDALALKTQEVKELWNQLVRLEPAELEAALRKYPRNLRINTARRALQLSLCNQGTVAAHIPLDNRLFRRLQNSMNES